MSDLFDDLLAGPDAVTECKLRDGRKFSVRSGTRTERNKIEAKMRNENLVMDAIAATLYFRVANSDGSPKFASKDFKKFAEELDYDMAAEMALVIRKLDGSEDNLTIDERTETHLKNSESEKADI